MITTTGEVLWFVEKVKGCGKVWHAVLGPESLCPVERGDAPLAEKPFYSVARRTWLCAECVRRLVGGWLS